MKTKKFIRWYADRYSYLVRLGATRALKGKGILAVVIDGLISREGWAGFGDEHGPVAYAAEVGCFRVK